MRGCRKDTGVKVQDGFQVHAQFRFILVGGNHKGINQQDICRFCTNHFYKKKVANYCTLFLNHKKEVVSKGNQVWKIRLVVSPVPQSFLCSIKL